MPRTSERLAAKRKSSDELHQLEKKPKIVVTGGNGQAMDSQFEGPEEEVTGGNGQAMNSEESAHSVDPPLFASFWGAPHIITKICSNLDYKVSLVFF